MADQAIIITGGGGFVGRHLLSELQGAWPDAQPIVWDRSVENLPAGAAGVAMDITKPDSYRESLRSAQPAWIIHLAAVASAAQAQANRALAHQINVEGTRLLLETVQSVSPGTRVLAVSTADIYGQGSATPLPELPLAQATPRNPYAESKRAMEQMIEAHFNEQVLRVRPFPHIGPGQALGYVTADFASQVAALESAYAKASAGKGRPVIKVGNLAAQRDFTDVRDVVRAYRLLMELGKTGDVYHVASGRAVAIQTVLDRLLALASVPISVAHDPARFRPSDTSVLVGDATKLREATGWQPQCTFDETLADILAVWRQRAAAHVPGSA